MPVRSVTLLPLGCLAVAVMTACTTSPSIGSEPVPVPVSEPLNVQQEEPASDIWLNDSDGSVHIASGYRCRSAAVSFQLTGREIYPGRPPGDDVSCTYEAAEGGAIKLHLTDFGRDVPVEAHLKGTTERIQELYRRSRALQPPVTQGTDAVSAAFLIDAVSTLRPGTPMETAVWIKRAGRWHVKARATYEVDRRASVAAAIDALLGFAETDMANQLGE